MPYVKRDDNGNIIALYRDPQPGSEAVNDFADAEILSLVFGTEDTANQTYLQMMLNDLSFVRVLEDTIDILLDKNIINITDFPKEAVNRLRMRKSIRERCQELVDSVSQDDSIL